MLLASSQRYHRPWGWQGPETLAGNGCIASHISHPAQSHELLPGWLSRRGNSTITKLKSSWDKLQSETYSGITQGAFCNGLKQCRFADVGQPNLLCRWWSAPMELEAEGRCPTYNSAACRIRLAHIGDEKNRSYLFSELPGRPSRIFFSSTCFLGGIFLRELKVVRKVRRVGLIG